jgi:SAM-dependent methyltransferase
MSDVPLQLQLDLPGLQQNLQVLDPTFWRGCFNARENSMHQLSPYVGKMKSGMVRALLLVYSQEGETVLDPFCGSGVVPYEAVLLGRNAIGNDLSPYAYVLTMGKFTAPPTEREALARASCYMDQAEQMKGTIEVEVVPDWVRQFFHPEILRETLALFRLLRKHQEFFLQACILGILHHVRPGFLSYPASHLVPYLRLKMYPPEQYPHMYAYRDVRSRFLAKVRRAYRRSTPIDPALHWQILQENAMHLSVPDESVDAVVSSPPYFGALDYGRDNRLRLWFLGVEHYKELESSLTSNDRVYIPQMTEAVKEMYRVLKPTKAAVLVLGDYRRNGNAADSAETIASLASQLFPEKFVVEAIIDDPIPDERRSRRRTRTTSKDRVLVLRKKK